MEQFGRLTGKRGYRPSSHPVTSEAELVDRLTGQASGVAPGREESGS